MKTLKRSAAVILAAALLLCVCACSKRTENSGGALSIGEYAIDAGMYRFLYATYKAQYLSKYSDASDTAAFWSARYSDGTTNAEHFDSLIRDNIRMYLVAVKLFDDTNLKLSGATLASIDEYIESTVTERFDSNREAFESALASYGADSGDFRDFLISNEKMARLFDHWFGSGGVRQLTDDERASFYRRYYVRFAQINVNNVYAYVEQDGVYVQDESGAYKTRELTESEKAEKDRVCAEIDAALDAGKTVEALYPEYSENTDYPGGYYFSRESAADYDAEIVDAAFALAVGETAKLQTAHGTFWIERLDLPEHGWTLTGSEDFFDGFDKAVKNSIFDALLISHFGEITENEDLISDVRADKLKPNRDLY